MTIVMIVCYFLTSRKLALVFCLFGSSPAKLLNDIRTVSDFQKIIQKNFSLILY